MRKTYLDAAARRILDAAAAAACHARAFRSDVNNARRACCVDITR